MTVTKDKITRLINEYKKLHRTPFIIEVLGTPNAGKTTAIYTFETILSRTGIRHKVIYEAAEHCIIRKKLSPEYNIWTLSETINQLLEVQDSDIDLVICERGLMDALCWFQLYYHDNLLTEDEYDNLANFILLNRFIHNINCCFVMQCSVATSIERENISEFLDITGTVINETVLTKYNCALESVKSMYGDRFQKIITLDTSELSQSKINRSFISSVTSYLKELAHVK